VKIVWKHGNREKIEEDIKLSMLSMKGMTQLEGGKWKRERFCALNIGQGKRSCGRTRE